MNLNKLSQKLEDHLTGQDIQDAQELLDNTYQEIVDMRGELVEAQAEIERLRAKVAELAECVKMAAELQDSDLIDFGAYGLTCDSDIVKKYRAALEGLSDEFEVPDELGVIE